MKLELRLSLALTAVTAVALGASCIAVYLLAARDEIRNLDTALYAEAEATAAIVETRNADAGALAEITERSAIGIVTVPVYVAVYANDGTLLSTSPNFANAPRSLAELGPGEGDRAMDLPIGLDASAHALRGVVVPIAHGGRRLLLAASRQNIDADRRSLIQILGAIYLSVLSGTSLVARWLGRRLAGDVRAIAAVARRVAQGDLAARVGGAVRGSEETSALASDLDHMIAQLSALFSSQRTFISHAAHELRSPLSAMRGELQLALRRPRENEDYQRTLVEVLADVEALIQLAEDLLTLARIQAGVPSAAGVAAVDVVTDAARLARGLAEVRNVEVRTPSTTTPDASIVVAGTRGDVARALRNLIENAIAHSPEGGRVEVALEAQADQMSFVVTDRGSGVGAEDAPNLFEPFFRGRKAAGGEPGGAGLGLAIAREIARAWGGDVLHDPRHTPGARFVLELPRAAVQSSTAVARSTELTAAGR